MYKHVPILSKIHLFLVHAFLELLTFFQRKRIKYMKNVVYACICHFFVVNLHRKFGRSQKHPTRMNRLVLMDKRLSVTGYRLRGMVHTK